MTAPPDVPWVARTLRPCGDTAVLVEVADLDEALGLHAALRADPPPGLVDLVPAARTVLVRVRSAADLPPLADDLRTRAIAPRGAAAPDAATVVEIPVRYDGDDLDDVAALVGMTCGEVVAAHTGQVWTVAFAGFTPGFGYLASTDTRLHVPRRSDPRTAVPTGAVGLAGEFSGVYPRVSPGGWQLIGRTERPMWDEAADPPAVLVPGARVRFVDLG